MKPYSQFSSKKEIIKSISRWETKKLLFLLVKWIITGNFKKYFRSEKIFIF
jgi:hypothetical protein